MNFLIRVLIIYLIYKIVSILIRKAIMYYRAYRSLQAKRRRMSTMSGRRDDFNLRAFDIEDADYEEIKPGQERNKSGR